MLNFLNTGGGDTKLRDVERLVTFSSFLSWSEANNIISSGLCHLLQAKALSCTSLAERHIAEAIAYREAVYGFLYAVVRGQSPCQADLLEIESNYRSALAVSHLVRGKGDEFEWQVPSDNVGLGLPKYRLALLTSTLITQTPIADIRQCEMCSWLFIDASATKRRRWCSMALCGNRAKAQRHYYRSREI